MRLSTRIKKFFRRKPPLEQRPGQPLKFLFLDIDGVLWTCAWAIYATRIDERRLCYRQWDPIACSNLQWVLDQCPELRIVISSTWRLGRSLKELKAIAKRSGLDPRRIVDVTPRLPCIENVKTKEYKSPPRGHEIQAWMNAGADGINSFPVEPKNIVILDDDSDMAHLAHRQILTDSADGFTFTKAMELAKLLGVRNP